jgi:hypothetical protein
MKKQNLKDKVYEEIKYSLNRQRFDKTCDHICASGLIDLEGAKDDYRLPKQIVCAILKQLYLDYKRPFSNDKEFIKGIENIWLGIDKVLDI